MRVLCSSCGWLRTAAGFLHPTCPTPPTSISGIEHVEADLVPRHMSRVVQGDAFLPPRQLFRVFASEVGLDEVARHGLDARAPA